MSPTTIHGLKCLALFAGIAVISGAPHVFPILRPLAPAFTAFAAALGAMVNPQAPVKP